MAFALLSSVSAIMRFLGLLGVPVVFAVTAVAAQDCSTQQTQADINGCIALSAGEADAKLNKVYETILKRYAGQPKFIAALRKAQRAWIAFRDAQIGALFPGDPSHYGSVLPMCTASAREELTNARTAQLQVWLQGTSEGDVCTGSVNVN